MAVRVTSALRTKAVRQMAVIVHRDELDGVWRCRYCRRHLPARDRPWLDDGTGTWPVRDHVVPRARGGSDLIENLVLACTHCNVKKGATLLEELPAGWYGSAA